MNNLNQELIHRVREWATENKDFLCVLIGGSQGNKHKITDQHSDVDVVIFAKNRRRYDKDLSWIKRFGEVASYHEDKIEVPLIYCVHKIYFTNGSHLDLLFWDKRMLTIAYRYLWLRQNTRLLGLIPQLWRNIIVNHFAFFPKYIYRGYTLLIDKKNYRRKMEYIGHSFKFVQSPFSIEKLQAVVSRFWAYAYSTAISISRNELICTKVVGDHIMKFKLVQMIELYAKCRNGQDYDVFEKGRHLEKWAPGFIVERLPLIYGLYEAGDAWRALTETMDLFSLICISFSKEFPEIRFTNPELHFRKLISEIRDQVTAVA